MFNYEVAIIKHHVFIYVRLCLIYFSTFNEETKDVVMVKFLICEHTTVAAMLSIAEMTKHVAMGQLFQKTSKSIFSIDQPRSKRLLSFLFNQVLDALIYRGDGRRW